MEGNVVNFDSGRLVRQHQPCIDREALRLDLQIESNLRSAIPFELVVAA